MTKLSCLPWLAALLVVNPISFSLGANAAYQQQRRQEVDTPDGTTTFLKAGHPDPSASSSLNCLPAASGAFGGVASCIPIPTSTADGLVDGAPSSTLGGVEGVPTTTTTTPLGFLPPPPPVTTTTPADPADITTYTTLPPGASFITLASGEFTSPQFITTTLPGSSSATVVPVIVPTGSGGGGGGPPVICAGCPFPAAIIIPPIGGGGGGGGGGFCFQLFGLKIGSCPGDGNDNSGGGDDGSKPTDTPKSDKPSETTGETPTSTTQASACSISITATYESVFCTVAATTAGEATAKRARRDDAVATGCSTKVYSTVTACEEAAGATTTVTTTVQPLPVFRCSQDNCGNCDNAANDAARLLRGKRNDDTSLDLLAKRLPPGRQDPAPGKVATPADYSGPDLQDAFMRGETYQISADRGKDGLITLSVPGGPLATSKFILWKDQPAAIGLKGLYGCTAVVVVSKKGAWIGHFWETPHFIGDDETFRINVLDPISQGRGDKYHMFGLAQLRNSATMLGNDFVGDVFNDVNEPRVFMMIPRLRILDRSVPQAIRMSSTAGSNLGPAFIARTQDVAGRIRTIFGNANFDIKQVDYSPMALTDAESDAMEADPLGRASAEAMARINDKGWDTSRGKLLVQFEPKAPNDCNDHNKVRVFFENHPLNYPWPSWMTLPPNLNNPNPPVLAPNGELTWRRRRSLDARDEGDACELNPSSTGAPATTEAVSSGAESTPAGTSPTPACLSAADGSFGGVEGCAPAPTVTSQPPAEPTSTTDSEPPATTATEMSCLPPADGAFGGVASCIPGPTITQPPPDPTTTAIPPPNTSALCSSWNCQQDGSCTCQDPTPAPTPTPTLPPRSPPNCLGEAYSNNVGFERNDGVNWATEFCNSQSMSSATLREFNPKNPTLYQNLNELTEGTWYAHLSAEEGAGAIFCQEGEVLTDHYDVDKCIASFTTVIDSCAPFEWVEQDKPFVKYSGWILANCYNWTIEIREDPPPHKLGIGRREAVELH